MLSLLSHHSNGTYTTQDAFDYIHVSPNKVILQWLFIYVKEDVSIMKCLHRSCISRAQHEEWCTSPYCSECPIIANAILWYSIKRLWQYHSLSKRSLFSKHSLFPCAPGRVRIWHWALIQQLVTITPTNVKVVPLKVRKSVCTRSKKGKHSNTNQNTRGWTRIFSLEDCSAVCNWLVSQTAYSTHQW